MFLLCRERKDCNTQSPSPAERLPSLGRSSRALHMHFEKKMLFEKQSYLFLQINSSFGKLQKYQVLVNRVDRTELTTMTRQTDKT